MSRVQAALSLAILAVVALPHSAVLGETANMSFIENGKLKLGADLSIGGSITYLSATNGPNMINSHDWGRQIQMSFYSGPTPFEPGGKEPHKSWAGLGWNPIQSGDCYGKRSTVLEHCNDGSSIYVKCRPMHWPLDNQPGQCIFECWYQLDGNRVHVKSRLTNARDDKTQYSARTQELPAIYTNGRWYKLVSYKGDKPFTGAEPTILVDKDDGKGWPWRNFYTPEHWVALLDDHNRGLGVYHPEAYSFTGGYAGKPKGSGGPKSVQTGYMGPTIPEVLDHNIVYSYEYTLIVGSLDEIRTYVYAREKPVGLPHWRFSKSREHWTYANIRDRGWPITDGLRFELGTANATLLSPKTFWHAEACTTLALRAAFKTAATSAKILLQPYDDLDAGDWAQWGAERAKRPKPAAPVVIPLDIKGDGNVRDWMVDLSKAPGYQGAMTQVKLVLPPGPGMATLYSVALSSSPETMTINPRRIKSRK